VLGDRKGLSDRLSPSLLLPGNDPRPGRKHGLAPFLADTQLCIGTQAHLASWLAVEEKNCARDGNGQDVCERLWLTNMYATNCQRRCKNTPLPWGVWLGNLHGKKRKQTGGFRPGIASPARPGRQEPCVGGPHMEATFVSAPGNQNQTIDERRPLPRTSMGKNAIGSTKGKKQKKEGPVKISGDSDQKQGYANNRPSRSIRFAAAVWCRPIPCAAAKWYKLANTESSC
jgi:hypothetical protein